MKHRHIVVEGAIGSGKTSLATRLAHRLNARTLLEDPAANPFLAHFYRDMRRYALQTQLFFLFQRVALLEELKQPDLFGKPVVADFSIGKDPLFAEVTLEEAEYQLYKKIFGHVRPQAAAPDLVIYLQAPVETLAYRLRKRGNAVEAGIPDSYLQALSDAYTRYFHHYSESPLLIVNSEKLNFVEKPAHLDMLIERIEAMRGGREFFNLQ